MTKYRVEMWLEIETEANIPQVRYRGTFDEVAPMMEKIIEGIEPPENEGDAMLNAKCEVVISKLLTPTVDPY